jgi:8-oxo-dGTP pyrophosphatase MutT (NUDIX family)
VNSGDEMVDVVDAEDRVVGQATRAEMRRRGLRHRAVYILVFNGAGQLFVHRRTATKDIYPSFYDVAAGGVLGAGESYDDGARRELGEELGVDVPLRRLFDLRFDDEQSPVNGVVYSCSSEGPFHLQASEIESGSFLDLAEVIELAQREPFCPDGVEVLRLYLDRLEAASRRRS